MHYLINCLVLPMLAFHATYAVEVPKPSGSQRVPVFTYPWINLGEQKLRCRYSAKRICVHIHTQQFVYPWLRYLLCHPHTQLSMTTMIHAKAFT